MNLWQERFWTPMLLKEVYQPFNDPNYIFEVKFDGMRAIIFASPLKIIIYNRHQKEITYLFPELNNIKVTKNVIFDGEIISLDKKGPSFTKLQKRSHLKNKTKINYQSQYNPVIFICFDILYEDRNLTNLDLIKRKEILAKYPNNQYFYKSFYIKEFGKKLFSKIKKFKLEGIVAKEIHSKYLISKRTDNWLKIKNYLEEYFYIGGFIEKEKIILLLLGEFQNDLFCFVGKVILSKKSNLYLKVKEQKILKKSSFSNLKNINVNYLNPLLKIKIKYMARTKNNHLRQPFRSKKV